MAHTFLVAVQQRRFPLVVDDVHWAALLRAQGWSPLALEDFDFQTSSEEVPLPVWVLASRLSTTERLRRLWGEAAMPICHLSLAKFEARPEVLEAVLASLLAWDVEATLAERQRQYQALLSAHTCRVRTEREGGRLADAPADAHTNPVLEQPQPLLTVRIHDEVEVANMGEQLEPGHLYALSEFGEAALLNLSGPASSFTLSGLFCFDDFSSLSNTEQQQQRFGPTLATLRLKARAGENWLRLEENQLRQVVMGGEDCTAQLQALFEGCLELPEWGLSATELGIGCVRGSQPPKAELNTPLNRTVPGFFVGIGRGARIPHLDFIAWNAHCTFLSGT